MGISFVNKNEIPAKTKLLVKNFLNKPNLDFEKIALWRRYVLYEGLPLGALFFERSFCLASIFAPICSRAFVQLLNKLKKEEVSSIPHNLGKSNSVRPRAPLY